MKTIDQNLAKTTNKTWTSAQAGKEWNNAIT